MLTLAVMSGIETRRRRSPFLRGDESGGEPEAPGVFRQLHGPDRQRDHRPARRHRPGAAGLRHAGGRQLVRDHPGARLPDPAARRAAGTVVRRCRAAGALPQHAGDQLHRRRLRHDRRRCLHRRRRHRGEPVGHQLGAGGRACPGHDAVAHQEDRAVRTRDEAHGEPGSPPLCRQQPAQQDGGHHRHRPYRPARRRTVRRAVRQHGARLRPVSDDGADRRARRHQGGTRRTAAPLGLRHRALPAQFGDLRHVRCRAVRRDEAVGVFHQHRARRHPR